MRTDYIKEQLNKAGIAANDDECAKLDKYLDMIVETNKMFNLTAITEFEDMVEKHLVDSLLLLSSENVSRETFLDAAPFDKLVSVSMNYEGLNDSVREKTQSEEENVSRETILPDDNNVSRETISQNKVRWIDVGTGAGLPGIPLKVMCPETEFTLLDSLKKRVNFLGEVINTLDLTDISAVHARAEDLARDPAHRDAYDICVSRAVANLSTLLELCLPFVRKGGYFAAYKSDNVSEELKAAKNALKKLNGTVSEVRHINLPGSEAGRTLIIIRKNAETSPFYPRKAGQPSKKPL